MVIVFLHSLEAACVDNMPKGVQRREAFRPKDEGGFEPGAKFDAASTYRDTYTPKELAPRR